MKVFYHKLKNNLLIKNFKYKGIVTLLLIGSAMPFKLSAQSLSINYNISETYTAGTAITPLLPTSTGVAAAGYSASPVTLASGLTLTATGSNPGYVAVDKNGNVYITTGGQGNAAVYKIPAGGGTPVNIGGDFNEPSGIAVDTAGNVYVADEDGGGIYKIPVAGGSKILLDDKQYPTGLAVDAAGNVYVVYYNNDSYIEKIPVGGGAPVILPQSFAYALGVAVDAAGNVYVADANNGIYKILAGGGNPILVSNVSNPYDVAVDAGGNIFAATYNDGVVEVPNGSNTTVVLGSGFTHPVGIAVDAAENVYVGDVGNGAVKEINPVGGYYISPALPAGLSLNNSTGAISGTPLVSSPATTYTILAYNSRGSSSATTSIKVVLPPVPVVSYTTPQTYIADEAITPLKPTSHYIGNAGFSTIPSSIGAGFSGAHGVAVDAAGNVYIADSYNNAVKEIPVGGGAPISLGSGFNGPAAVAIDAAGNVYVADQYNNAIKKIPAGGGTPVTLGYGFNNPAGVAVDAFGNVYVADYGNNVLKEIPVGGGTPFVLGAGFIGRPNGVAVDTYGNIYVADQGYNAVEEIPLNKSPVTLSNNFNSPNGIAVDIEGNVYVADEDTSVIKEIPAGGGTMIHVGSAFSSPEGVAVDAFGNIYVADADNSTAKEIKLIGGYYIESALPPGLTFSGATGIISGTPTRSIPTTNFTVIAYNFSFSKTTTVNITVNLPPLPAISYTGPQSYIAGTAISPLSPTNTLVAPPAYSSTPVILGSGFSYPDGVTTDAAGNIYVADYNNNAVKKIPAGGGTPVTIGTFPEPNDVAIDAAGNIYVASNNQTSIYKLAAGSSTPVTIGSGLKYPNGLTVDVAGNVYVADYGNNAIKEIPVGGGAPIILGSGFSSPTAVAVDASGNVYVADYLNNAVKEIPAGSGNQVITIGSGFNYPGGVAVDLAGNVYVADAGSNTIKEIPAGNNATITIGSGFNLPGSVAIDGAGNVYLADQNNNAVKEIKPVGGYYINPLLPAGISFNYTTGVISGTPNVASAATNYKITGYNLAGGTAASVSIKTYLPPLPTLSYSGPQTYVVNKTITALKPANSSVSSQAYIFNAANFGSGFNQPFGVAIDAAGNLYVADYGNNAVKKIPVGGGAPISLGSGFNEPAAVAVDAAGNVYVADQGDSEIKKIPVGGGAVIVLAPGFSLDDPSGVAVDAAGNVYVADQSTIKEIPVTGGVLTLGSGFDFQYPSGVAVDAAGNIYVADSGNGAVEKIPAGNGIPIVIGSGFSFPQAVTVDGAGNVYVAQVNGEYQTAPSGIVMIPANGASPVTLAASPSPQGLAVNAAGNIFVADQSNYVIKEITQVGGYYLSSILPAGLGFSNSTGIISGTPTALSPATNYNITAYNIGGNVKTTVNLSVTAAVTLTFAAIPSQVYGAVDFAPGATGGTITYTSSNTSVATIVSGNLHIVGAGTSTITANNGTTTATQTLTVTPAPLTITANNQTAIQGTALPSLTVAYTGFVNADSQSSLTTLPVAGTAATSSSAMGYYPITVTGGMDANYTITDVAGRLTMVTEAYLQAPITTTYGNADFYAFSTATTGVTYTSSNTAVATVSSVGLVHITGSGAATITFGKSSGHLNKNITVNPAALTITADNKTGIQGTPLPAFTFTYTGFVNGDSQSSLTDLPNATTTATSASGTGYYPITVTGGTSPNYTITDVNGRLTMVTQSFLKAPITTTYGNADFYTFGSATTGVTYSSSNSNVATVSQTGLIHIVSAGSITITFGNTNGTLNKSLTVNPAALTITANNQTKAAGAANPTLTVSYSGFVNGDSQSSLSTQPAVTTTATTSSVAGSYPLTASGAADANYTITYVAGILTVSSASGHDIALTDALLPQSETNTNGPTVNPAVSPNGDGVNDVLTIANIGKYPDNKLTVINPGGSVIFEAANYDNISNVFDGHSSTTRQMQQPGTYFYVLQYKDSGVAKTKTGFIVLKY